MAKPAQIYQFPGSEVREPRARSPQLEDGYTRIANELYEVVNNAHACPVTLTQLRIVHAVIRRTYGFNKTMDALADTQIAADTGIPRQKVNPAKHALIAMKVLVLSEDGRKIGVNKRYDEWDFSARPEKKAPQRKAQPDGDSVTKKVTSSVTKPGTHKRQKDNLEPKGSKDTSKKSSPKKWGEPIDHELAEFMFEALTSHLTNPKRPSMTSWANEIRLTRTRDGRTPEQIRFLCKWIAKDSFWRGNVMSPSKLREKWDQLESKVIAEKESRHANRHPTDSRRAEQDRIAASLADPHDTSWAHGLFDEGGAQSDDSGAGEPGFHADGGDFPEDVEAVVFDGRNAATRKAGACVVDGELVIPADTRGARHDD